MSKETIYREDAIKAVEELPNAYNGWSDAYDKAYIISTLEEVPKADRPQGKWIAKTENYHSHWVCSECGGWALLEYNEQMCLSNYCPNCGCRMKGADDE